MSKISRREFLRVSTVVAGGAILTACGAQPTPEAAQPTEAPKGEVQPTEAPKGPERPTTWPLGDVPRNRTLVYHNNTPSAGNVNPFAAGFTHQNGNAILIEPGAFYAAHADKTYMWLVESYKYNADATQIDLTLRKGIKWSDGVDFTTKDVATSMERLKRVPGLNKGGTYVTELEKVEVIDDLNMKVILNKQDWRFFFKSLTARFDLGDYVFSYPEHVWKDVPDDQLNSIKMFDKEKKWPVTTAAYGVSEAAEQYTNFDLWPTWWAVETGFVEKYPDPWRIRQETFTNNNLAGQKLINKEADHTLDLRPLMVASLLAQAGDYLSTWTGKKPPFGYTDWWPISVQFCTAKPPFDNLKVRWAVAYALDQQKVVDVGWAGAGMVANSPFPHFKKLDEYMEGIKDLTEKYNVLEVNLEKSAQLMQEAGFTKDSENFWVDKDGVRVDANIFADANLFGDLAPVVAENLRSSGFACEHKSPPDVWAASVDGRASLFLFGHGGATIDPWDTFNLYYKEPVKMGEQEWGNITRWQNAEFKAITDEMNGTPMDDAKMKELFRKGMEIWYKDLPDLPLVQWYHRIPINNWYFTNWPDETNPYMNSALWHETMLQVVLGLKATGNT